MKFQKAPLLFWPIFKIRIDETYIKVKGQGLDSRKYLYRAIDKHGVSIDFLTKASRDKGAAMRFFRKAFKDDRLFAHCSH